MKIRPVDADGDVLPVLQTGEMLSMDIIGRLKAMEEKKTSLNSLKSIDARRASSPVSYRLSARQYRICFVT